MTDNMNNTMNKNKGQTDNNGRQNTTQKNKE